MADLEEVEQIQVDGAGGGGSSFISGHNGCDAISEESVTGNIKHTGQSTHYSGYIFKNTTMIDGSGYKWLNTKQGKVTIPSPGSKLDISKNGGVKITVVK